MLKIFVYSLVLLILLIGNMTLFTWCATYLSIGKAPLEKTLINNVQATVAATPNRDVQQGAILRIKKPLISKQLSLSHPLSRKESNQQIILRFQPSNIHLKEEEQGKLQMVMKKFNITSFHAAHVFVGPAPSEDNASSLQTIKLRAQTIARAIYPHTQVIKMVYKSSLETNVAIVEFFKN